MACRLNARFHACLWQLWEALEKRLDRELADGASDSSSSGSGDAADGDNSSEDDDESDSIDGRQGNQAAPLQEEQPSAGFQLFGSELCCILLHSHPHTSQRIVLCHDALRYSPAWPVSSVTGD